MVALKKHFQMKHILVATDFSTASHNAFLYSLQLAQSLEARIVLFSAFQPVDTPHIVADTVISSASMQVAVHDRLVQHLRAAGSAAQVPITLGFAEGPAVERIIEEASKQRADLIVCGMKEHGKGFRQVFGSTVTGLARHSTVPVLVIPETAGFKQPRRIALANDILPEANVHTLDMLATIGQCFLSSVFIVRVLRDRFEEVFEMHHPEKKHSHLVRALDTQYEYYRNKQVTEALTGFIHEQQIDLMALIPHQHSLLERLFFKSQTKSMIFRTEIPLLILPENKAQADPSAAPIKNTDVHWD